MWYNCQVGGVTIRQPKFQIIVDDVRRGLDSLPDGCADLVCTSPPYWAQRDYQVEGQIGHEPTSQEFVDTLVEIFGPKYCGRVLKPHGSIFLNLGDSMNGSGGDSTNFNLNREGMGILVKSDAAYKPRDLMDIPHRVYEGLRQQGYYWRSTIAWVKSNPMPSSVGGVAWKRHRIKVESAKVQFGSRIGVEYSAVGEKDRMSWGHPERQAKWEPCPGCDRCSPNGGYILYWGSGRPNMAYEEIGFLTKRHYYWDDEAVRSRYGESTGAKMKNVWETEEDTNFLEWLAQNHPEVVDEYFYEQTRLSDIWKLPTAQFKQKHYATYPVSLPTLAIKAATSEYGNCATCGKPWARVLEQVGREGIGTKSRTADVVGTSESSMLRGNGTPVYQTIGWRPTCRCGTGERIPAVILDPFSGAGTTLLAANRLGRDAIGIEISPDYAKLAEERILSDILVADAEDFDEELQPERMVQLAF